MTTAGLLLLFALARPAAAEPVFASKGPRGERQRVESGSVEGFEVKPPTSAPRELRTEHDEQPWPIRLMIHPLKRGMFIGLPVIDTDPNRGVTMGFMPIWVIQEGERIKQIWAPSVSYNPIFQIIPTFRHYTYPTRDSDLSLRASLARITDREIFGEWHDRNFQHSGFETGIKVQYNVDGSKRFFGIGPDTDINAESNYVEDLLTVRSLVGVPLGKGTGWMAKASHYVLGMKVSDGPINSIPDINAAFPGRAPFHRHQNSNFRLGIDYDSRDHDVATTRGTLAALSLETSQRAIGSEYVYQQYNLDLRHFHPWKRAPKHGTAGMLRFTQVVGDPPFWLLPQLGGKYVHRAYGEGRYIDRGMVTAQLEHRYTFYSVKMAGVTTEFEVAPFAGAGTVFDEPERMAKRYLRPVVGGAIRAVARPQVVGSIDFGMGQEGMTAFMDINYSF